MNREIELKYKIDHLPESLKEKMYIDQIYFDSHGKLDFLEKQFDDIDIKSITTFRLRKIIINDIIKYVLTLKSKTTGYGRDEYEKEISEEDFNYLKEKQISEIIKYRYVYNYDRYTFEFDEYLNLKEKLFTCEVELSEMDNVNIEKILIEKCLKDYFNVSYIDVSFDPKYKNSNLHKL